VDTKIFLNLQSLSKRVL